MCLCISPDANLKVGAVAVYTLQPGCPEAGLQAPGSQSGQNDHDPGCQLICISLTGQIMISNITTGLTLQV